MGLNYEEAKRCGLAHLYPTGGKSTLPVVVPPAKSAAPDDGMNKLERAFWGRLQEARPAWFREVHREPMAIRLAGRTRYTPDFMGIDYDDEHPIFFEVKGFMRDDAAVKLKVAADMFGYFVFVLVTREKRIWLCRRVTRNGISREIWTPDWLR